MQMRRRRLNDSKKDGQAIGLNRKAELLALPRRRVSTLATGPYSTTVVSTDIRKLVSMSSESVTVSGHVNTQKSSGSSCLSYSCSPNFVFPHSCQRLSCHMCPNELKRTKNRNAGFKAGQHEEQRHVLFIGRLLPWLSTPRPSLAWDSKDSRVHV